MLLAHLYAVSFRGEFHCGLSQVVVMYVLMLLAHLNVVGSRDFCALLLLGGYEIRNCEALLR
jgi:hypothetical protein